MSMLKERRRRSSEFAGIPLSAYLFGVLTGAAFVMLVGAILGFGISSHIFVPATVSQAFVIKVALSASSIIITIFAVAMTIRSQIRQRVITHKIDELYKKTHFLSNQ